MNALLYVNIDQDIHQGKKNKVAPNEKRKQLHGFSYDENMANFEGFCWVISSSISILFLKSAIFVVSISLFLSKEKSVEPTFEDNC